MLDALHGVLALGLCISGCYSCRLSKRTQQLEKNAFRDELTGLMNRRLFKELAFKELAKLARNKSPLSIVAVDVDHFKRINDTFGHDVGDEVLRQVSGTMEECSRSQDLVCRWGGEEFLILMPATDLESARIFCERMRLTLSRMRLFAEHSVTITASFGLTEVVRKEDFDAIICRADNALYRAKADGRNCIRSS